MRADRGRSEHRPRRLAGVGVALLLLGGLVPAASAQVTREDVQEARAEVRRLTAEIEALRERVEALDRATDRLASRLYEAEIRWEQTTAELNEVRARLERARERYASLRARLDQRAREAFMLGPGSGIEFLLGATSLADLSDRLEFVGAVAQSDADLAVRVDNLRNELAADEAELERLQERQAVLVRELASQQAALEQRLSEQRALLDEIEAKKAQARRVAERLSERYQQQLAQRFSGQLHDGVFQVCPVGEPNAVSDSFGAPRVGHLHAGVDIFAPYRTPIYAPFAGTARASYNGLGGYSVYVYGAQGYVYNAHLAEPGISGPVQPGDVIGYVGTSGNAQGTSPHDHFEWHPDQIPSDWPASPYGYSVLGGAVNPYPLLAPVC
ncbi:MAG TPA: peptidoglycan DD-metalloendopeptidase family protein [Actinomycetota bacterium]|nr:peptidoglycan DD-metalloendopeptidase family protein [Actinomycetota bacterium]